MSAKEAIELQHGPYSPPVFALEGVLYCEYLKCYRRVIDVQKGTGWPLGSNPNGQPSPIVIGELIRAIKDEPVLSAVSRYWQVTHPTARNWKKALGIERPASYPCTCSICGKSFLSQFGTQHCSVKCYNARTIAKTKAARATPHCLWCKVEIPKSRSRYCSDQCRRLGRIATTKASDSRHQEEKRLRDRLRHKALGVEGRKQKAARFQAFRQQNAILKYMKIEAAIIEKVSEREPNAKDSSDE